jgi:hypothetical protein
MKKTGRAPARPVFFARNVDPAFFATRGVVLFCAVRRSSVGDDIMSRMAIIAGYTSIAMGLATGSIALASAAQATDIAVRCGARGCQSILCDETGDRCYRSSEAEGAGYAARARAGHSYSREGRYGNEEKYEHGVCDRDGDRCYGSNNRDWDYREYYRRLGYRWISDEDQDEQNGTADHRGGNGNDHARDDKHDGR